MIWHESGKELSGIWEKYTAAIFCFYLFEHLEKLGNYVGFTWNLLLGRTAEDQDYIPAFFHGFLFLFGANSTAHFYRFKVTLRIKFSATIKYADYVAILLCAQSTKTILQVI